VISCNAVSVGGRELRQYYVFLLIFQLIDNTTLWYTYPYPSHIRRLVMNGHGQCVL
jgi:hypothetical protein